MMKKLLDDIKVVLFDHDDTLVATIEAKWAEHKYIAKTFYGKDLSDDEIRPHWGKPLSTVMRLLYGTDDVDTAMAHNLAVHENFPKKLHDDTLEVLEALRKQGKKLGVITATHRISLDHDLKTMDLSEKLFDYLQTEENTSYHKPDPRVFEPAIAWLESLGVKLSETLYIGDGLQDMKAALGAGFEFMGVSTGLVTQADFKTHGARAMKKLSDLL